MLTETINSYLRRQPFIPFRIEKTGGVWYDVNNPAMASATRHMVELALPIENGKQRFVTIAIMHVLSVESCYPFPEANQQLHFSPTPLIRGSGSHITCHMPHNLRNSH